MESMGIVLESDSASPGARPVESAPTRTESGGGPRDARDLRHHGGGDEGRRNYHCGKGKRHAKRCCGQK